MEILKLHRFWSSLIWILLILSLSSCSKQVGCWRHQEVLTNELKYNSERIYAYADESFCGLEYEIIRDHCCTKTQGKNLSCGFFRTLEPLESSRESKIGDGIILNNMIPSPIFDSLGFEACQSTKKPTTQVKSYINVFTGSIPPAINNPCSSTVYLTIDGKTYSFLAQRMKGEQRLLIPESYTKLMISALLSLKKLVIRLDGGFFAEFPACGFPEEWYRKSPLISMPYLFKGA